MPDHEDDDRDPELVIAEESDCGNESEALFLRLCQQLEVRCYRVLTSTSKGQKRPDFKIAGAGFFEIKEVETTDRELSLLRRRQPRFMHEDERRRTVRNSIKAATKQLKYASDRSLPGVVVVRLNRGVRFNLLDLEIICFGARHSLTLLDPSNMDRIRDTIEVAGGERILTSRHNTRLSAIALLTEYGRVDVDARTGSRVDTLEPRLLVLHSPFAAHPLDPDAFSSLPSKRIVHMYYQFDPETGLASLNRSPAPTRNSES